MTPDDKEIRDIQKKMHECVARLTKLAPLVGMARHVKDFSPDQRKNALAAAMLDPLQRGESAAFAEAKARSDPTYLEKLKQLGKDYSDACATITEWEAVNARLEVARSIHAMLKETVRNLEG